MTHQSMYRKMRPRTFDEVVGQASVVSAIKRSIVDPDVVFPQSIILSGLYGCGKTTLARLIAAAANCEFREEGSANPCGGSNPECETCPGIIEGVGNMGSVTEIDAATNRSLDSIREHLRSMSVQVSTRYNIFIIDEVHRLTPDAQTALLKTIEEPPPGIVIIMATTDPNSLGSTFLSRPVHYRLSALDNEDIEVLVRRTAEAYDLDLADSDMNYVLSRSNNSGRDALRVLEQWSQGTREESTTVPFLRGISDAIADGDPAAVIILLNDQIVAGNDVESCLKMLTDHFRNTLIALQAPSTLRVPGEHKEAAEYAAERLNLRTVMSAISTLLSATRTTAVDSRLALETALLEVATRKGKSGTSSGGTGVTQKDIDAIADAVQDRIREEVESAVSEALRGMDSWPAPLVSAGEEDDEADEPVRSVTVEADLEDVDKEVARPLPPPRDDDRSAGPAPFDADKFMKALRSADISRHAGVLLARSAHIEDDSGPGEHAAVLVTSGGRLKSRDWDTACKVMKAKGWTLYEHVEG